MTTNGSPRNLQAGYCILQRGTAATGAATGAAAAAAEAEAAAQRRFTRRQKQKQEAPTRQAMPCGRNPHPLRAVSSPGRNGPRFAPDSPTALVRDGAVSRLRRERPHQIYHGWDR